MGFDPRHWSGRGRSEQRVTSNVEALLAENDALRREVARLTRELELVRRWRPDRETASAEAPRRIHPAQIEAWGAALAGQAGWGVLRQSALNALVDQLNRDSFPAQLTLQQRLDRLAPGLGHDLMAAIGARRNKKIAAVLAAFALYGVRASEWLDEDPRRVVADLRQRLGTHSHSASGRGRRTRSDRRRSDRVDEPMRGDARSAALAELGLDPGAGTETIKRAFRRLVKLHHPDVGGSPEAFRRVSEAYQQLIQ